MDEKEREKLRKKIERDLKSQLKKREIKGGHYLDLIQDYLSLWDLKCALLDDISCTGIQVPGMHGPKSNPSINDLHKTNDRMIKILDAIGLKAVPVEIEPKKQAGRSAKDLV